MKKQPGEITRLLKRRASGDAQAHEELYAAVYQDLRRIAAANIPIDASNPTLSATALVNEAYLRLTRHSDVALGDRKHFYRVAAKAMRQITVDHARRKLRNKRGGGLAEVTLDEEHMGVVPQDDLVVALGDALAILEQVDERLVRVVECRFFAGYTDDETAQALGISRRTVLREWQRAKAWLTEHLSE